jgi:phospholipid/cholesterol/gamma-HCH transport system substrate-binding protein
MARDPNRRPRLPKSAFQVLAYTLVCLVLLAGLAVKIGNLHLFTHRHSYQAMLTDATGLNPGDDVKIAGVTVGQVGTIDTVRGQAKVDFSVDDNVQLPTITQVGVRWHNVLGQKYLYLYPGRTAGPFLASGATIPASQQVGDANVGAFLNSLGPIIQAINPADANAFVQGVVSALQNNQGQVSALIDNAATVSQTVGGLNVQVGHVIDNLATVLGALGSRSTDLQSVVSNLATVSAALASRNGTLDSVVGNFAQLSTEFAQLISSNRGNLDGAIANLQVIAADLNTHRADLNQSLGTLSQGLAPYALISSYGQWFNVQTVYTCLANETVCTYGGSGSAPGSNGAVPPSPLPSSGSTGAGSAGSGLNGALSMLAGNG